MVIIAAIELIRRRMQLRSCQLTLLTSLALGAVLEVSCAPLTSDESRSGGTGVHSSNGMTGFTTENIMKVHQGMGSNEILEMFGAPKNVSQSVCGGAVGRPWNCTTWEYRGFLSDSRARFTFSGKSGSLILNDFDVR
jgi:hypothetical protein